MNILKVLDDQLLLDIKKWFPIKHEVDWTSSVSLITKFDWFQLSQRTEYLRVYYFQTRDVTFILLENPLSFNYDTWESFIASVNEEL